MKNWKRQLAMMLAIAMLASTTPLPVAQAWAGEQMIEVGVLSDVVDDDDEEETPTDPDTTDPDTTDPDTTDPDTTDPDTTDPDTTDPDTTDPDTTDPDTTDPDTTDPDTTDPDTPDPDTTTYNVFFYANGGIYSAGNYSYPVRVEEGVITATIPEPTKAGCEFLGWYDAPTGGNKVTEFTNVGQDDAFYAQWTDDDSPAVTATFYKNDTSSSATIHSTSTLTGSATGSYALILPSTDPTLTGYTFNGWYTARTGGTKVTTSTTISTSTAYYAQWTSSTSHTVTLSLSDILPVLLSSVATQTIADGECVTDPELTYTNTGNDDKFYVVWYIDSSYANEWVFEDSAISASTTIYGRWEEADGTPLTTCEITYDYNEDLTGKADSSYDMYIGIQSAGFGTPLISGFSFEGWYDDDNYETEIEFPYLVEEDVTIYAKFVAEAESSLSGVITDHEEDAVYQATVKLVQGSTTKYTTTTNSSGEYSFDTVANGTYNLVVTYGDHIRMVEITLDDDDEEYDFELTKNPIISNVESISSISVLTVSGLDALALEHADDDAIVSINLSIETATDSYDKDLVLLNKNDDDHILQYLDISITKESEDIDTGKFTYTSIKDLSSNISVTIEIPEDYEDRTGFVVYRVHEDEVTRLTSSSNSNGEKISTDSTDKTLTITTRQFSTYALAADLEDDDEEDEVSNILPLTIKQKVNGFEISTETGGTVTPSTTNPVYGTKIDFTITPNSGYVVTGFSAVEEDGGYVAVVKNATGGYSITQQSKAITVTAEFTGNTSATAPTSYTRFSDIPRDQYYFYFVYRAKELGLIDGYEDGTFRPEVVTTRAQVAIMLYRMAGSPMVYVDDAFHDVKSGDWYTSAVLWAKNAGIVSGYENGNFGPDDSVTREQLAVMLYKYAAYTGKNMSVNHTLTFGDKGSISSWAVDAVTWGNAVGLFDGYSGNFVPNSLSKRCDVSISLLALYNTLY